MNIVKYKIQNRQVQVPQYSSFLDIEFTESGNFAWFLINPNFHGTKTVSFSTEDLSIFNNTSTHKGNLAATLSHQCAISIPKGSKIYGLNLINNEIILDILGNIDIPTVLCYFKSFKEDEFVDLKHSDYIGFVNDEHNQKYHFFQYYI